MAVYHLLIVKVIQIIVAVLFSFFGSLVGKSKEQNVTLNICLSLPKQPAVKT